MPDYTFKTIPVSRINVDELNFRIGDQDTRRDAYRAMIEEQEADLVNLADDLIALGPSPAERFIVGPDPNEEGSYIVYEGNRRITAMKLMEEPDLTSGTSAEKSFRRLSTTYLRNPIQEVDCVVVKDKEAAIPWIVRKHTTMAGRGLSQWGAPATARWDAYKGRVRPSKAVLDHLRTKKLLPAQLDKRMARYTTNLDRVFQMPYLLRRLGIDIRRDGTIKFDGAKNRDGAGLLLDMVKAMSVEGFTVNEIRSAEQREAFIDGFADRTLVDQGGSRGGAKPEASKDKAGNGSKTRPRRRAESSLDRRGLALGGKAHFLTINDPRLNRLYHEALRIEAVRLPNSSTILMRVFLELSAEYYAKRMRLPLPKKRVKSGKTDWSDMQITLRDKVRAVLDHLDPTKKEGELANARRGVSGDTYLHSIDTLHQYVHNRTTDADGNEAKTAWERWHPFLVRLYDAINAQKS